jgi:hypothetical protein
MRCPVCDTDNLDAAAECASCGKALRAPEDDAFAEASPLEGLLPTLEAEGDLPVSPEIVRDLERTRIDQDADAPLSWTAGPLLLERTALAADPDAVSSWTGEVELDLGRERDAGPRTPLPPETAVCPWCGAASLDAVCDGCGQRKLRYAVRPEREAARVRAGETVSCPSCFARVPHDDRCSDCGTPFPVQEL